MADSGCGKTAFCSELVSPTRGSSLQVTLRKKLLGYHFCSVTLHDSLSAMNFLRSLSRQLVEHEVIGNTTDTPLPSLLHLTGIEDHAASDFQGAQHHTIPHLLSKYHQHFPQWLALVCTCSTKSKVTKCLKLSLDDITKSRVIQDIQQYILHRLDSDHSLKKHLNKEMAEILDKLHVKCNGCILYIELILDLVAHHSVSLWQVDSIPGTLGGLYLWMCQQLFADVTHYLSLVRPMFNVLLASRHPLTSTQIYNCVTTCYPHVKFEELTQCLQSIANILVSIYEDGRVVFFHSSFRLWLLDVKFSSRVYLCDPSNTDRSPDENTILTIHEQAVWMLLSEVHLLPAPSEQNSEREMAVADKLEGSSLLSSSYVSDDEEEGSKPDVSHTVNQVDASCSLKTDITISVGSENVSDGICETDDPLSVNRTQQEAYLDISHHVLSNSQQNFAAGSQNAADICEQVPASSSHNVTVDSKQAPVDLACSIELPHDPVSAAGSDAPLEELDCLDEELVDSDHLDVEDNTRDVVDHAPTHPGILKPPVII
ncbi:ANKRD50 [Bugula neritina]|uniref:ANKRD50 n=1 Tax=Bugula neritina TaxID=10212 RepID=A0A7J7JL97_BUGNE|nr:ANKRD50 [Bugula neritina]